jgi:hypothetical protein
MMTTSKDLVARMRSFTRTQLATFGASCATRISPILIAFSRTTSREQAEMWLDDLWAAIESADTLLARDLSARLTIAPVWTDNCHYPEWDAWHALALIDYAARIFTDEKPLTLVQWCSEGSLELLSGFDMDLKSESGHDDSLEDMELKDQIAEVDRLSDADVPLPIRRHFELALASAVYHRLPEVTDDVAHAQRWDLSRPTRARIGFFLRFTSAADSERAAARIGEGAEVYGSGELVRMMQDLPLTPTDLFEQEEFFKRIASEEGGTYEGFEQGITEL